MVMGNKKMKERVAFLFQQVIASESAPAEYKAAAQEWIEKQNDADETKRLAEILKPMIAAGGISGCGGGNCEHGFLVVCRQRSGCASGCSAGRARVASGHPVSGHLRRAAAVAAFDVMADKPCNNFIGSKSTWDNLRIIPKDKMPKLTPLHESDRRILMEGLDGVLSQTLQDKIWEMIWKRWCAYEDFCHSR